MEEVHDARCCPLRARNVGRRRSPTIKNKLLTHSPIGNSNMLFQVVIHKGHSMVALCACVGCSIDKQELEQTSESM